MTTVYFDYAATTPVDPRVLEEMLPYMSDDYGNASSIHHMGRKPSVVAETWRGKIASLLEAKPAEIIFTSGGTESNNAAIFGALAASEGKHIISAKTEHNAVLHPVEYAQKMGYEVSWLPLDSDGRVTPDALKQCLRKDTALVSLMHVNNETGTVQPIEELTTICKDQGVAFHCDTVQSVGKIPVSVKTLGVDFLSMSAHKIYGPKGSGALYVRSGAPWKPWMHGGSHERGRRGGTLNVPGICGLGKALELAVQEMQQNTRHLRELKDYFIQQLQEIIPDNYTFNGHPDTCIPHILSVTLKDHNGQPMDGEMLLLNLDMEGICCSNGAACTSGTILPSHVMMALGYNEDMARSTLRFSMGTSNTTEQVNHVIHTLKKIIDRHSEASS
ncbi:cysteine desulfurase family protein [Balneolaceae bacterium ANBcel3]|nr:cysteine desulfurase family protein [Balneolaceae bacterium ANBcel3]